MRRSILGTVPTFLAFAAIAQAASHSPNIDGVVGHYRFASGQVMTLERFNDSIVAKSRGQPQHVMALSEEGRLEFPSTGAHLTFNADAAGKATALHYHFEDRIDTANRIDEKTFVEDTQRWTDKINNQSHSPDCAATVGRLVSEIRKGKPDYSKLAPLLARAVRSQLAVLQPRFEAAGPAKEIKFKSVDPSGHEIFEVTFENGSVTTWRVLCLQNGCLGAAAFRL